MKKQWTSPRWQYVATWIFAILAIVSSLSALSQQQWEVDITAETASVEDRIWDNGHSETFETIEQRKNNE